MIGRLFTHVEAVTKRNTPAAQGAIHNTGALVHRELCATTDRVFKKFAGRSITDNFEKHGVTLSVGEGCFRSWGAIEQPGLDGHVSSRISRVDRITVLSLGECNLFEALHSYVSVASVFVSIAGYPVPVPNVDSFDVSHCHSRRQRDLQSNNSCHTARGYGERVTTPTSRFPPPPDESEIPIHSRTYSVKAFRIDGKTMRLRGQVTDTKPAGLYVKGDDEPLDVHDMMVDLTISFPMLEILSAEVIFDTHPHLTCTSIEPTFAQLAGVSIARGFNRNLTELFGGPRGCTHVVALLRAMGPVAVQSIYSMEAADPDRESTTTRSEELREREQRAMAFISDSCHVWAADGERMKAATDGVAHEAPIWIRQRLDKLGRSDELSAWS